MSRLNMNAQQQKLAEVLRSEIKAVHQLMHSLESEYAALAENQSTALEAVVQDKQNEIRMLEVIGKQREQIMTAMNSGSDQPVELDQTFKDNSMLSSLWHELVSLAEKCRDKNRVNGSIVETVSRQSQQAINILHGISPELSTATGLYDQSGHATSSAVKRSLTQV